jgi:hypothetical protein
MKHRIRLSCAGAALLAILAVVAGCGDTGPTGVPLRPDGLRVGSVAQAVMSPVAYASGTFSRQIGPDGGMLYFGVGNLTIPRGAVANTTTITAKVDGVSAAVDFGPEGLVFPIQARPVVELSSIGSIDPSRIGIVYVNDQARIVTVLPTIVDVSTRTARAYLDHFSPYILAQN